MSMVYLNGSILAESEAKVSVNDRGFLYGHSVFETMPVYNYRVFRLDEHLERLERSARKALIELPPLEALRAAVLMTVRVNLLQAGGLRLTVSAGVGGAGLLPTPAPEPTVVVSVRAPRELDEARREGIDLVISDVSRGLPSALPLDAKTGNMLTLILASQAVRDAGAFEAVLLDGQGDLAEGAISNLFIVRDGCVRTPKADGSVLPGITRGAVLEIARGLGLEVSEESLGPEALVCAEEIWLTSSLIEMLPVRSVAGRPLPGPWPLFARVHEAYRAVVQAECIRPPEERRRP